MPANKNALLRYKTIDRCLRNRFRRWTLDDLVDACSDALYDMEGIAKGVSTRTVQLDLQMMRSGKLGYYAPIEVYDNKYYKYSDPSFSITNTPLTTEDFKLVIKAISMIEKTKEGEVVENLDVVLSKLKKTLYCLLICE